jgi:hypothetical protein
LLSSRIPPRPIPRLRKLTARVTPQVYDELAELAEHFDVELERFASQILVAYVQDRPGRPFPEGRPGRPFPKAAP